MAAVVDGTLAFLLWPFVSLFLYVRFWLSLIICLPWIMYAMAVGKSFSAFIEFYAILAKVPLGLGKYVYTGFTGFFSPNNTVFSPVIQKFESGTIIATQINYPWHRNPFGSMHAMCLTSMAEYISAVAMMGAFQQMGNVRGIPVTITAKFHSKCKGTAKAVLSLKPEMIKAGKNEEPDTWENNVCVFDPSGKLCVEVDVMWTLSAVEKKKGKK
jgi:acyl-coenzyme A thioesterase PaaI-like protein